MPLSSVLGTATSNNELASTYEPSGTRNFASATSLVRVRKTMAERSSGSRTHSTATNKSNEEGEEKINDVNISDLLPLELMKSEIIPPIPNCSDSAVDWLQDFAGFSWIAYGASSVLVISHFPSPLSKEEKLIGPFFRQVIELSSDESVLVKAVVWSPSFPSEGELAAVVENCVCLYSGNSRITHGYFCWSQVGILLHSSTVDTVKWTGSGDGIIAVGVDVALWKRNGQSWEMIWKFRAKQPQLLVSTTWSIEGPAAIAPYLGTSDNEASSCLPNGASKCVLVFQNDVKHGSLQAELHHPQHVSMIKWRPLNRITQSKKGKLNSEKDVLLTCCLDGTVRLWSEIDSGRVKKSSKDANDQKHINRSLHVIAVIEINQSMNGTLGRDIFVTWAVEFKGLSNIDGAKQYLSPGIENNQPGRCEWLIGFGPSTTVSFWAVHCLDDISPLRFPRVTLWKRQLLVGAEVDHLRGTGDLNAKKLPVFTKAVTVRSQLFGPPVMCSLIQFLPSNSMSWLQLYSPTSMEDGSLKQSGKENCFSCSACGVLSLDGHSGRILQIALHPYSCEYELLVSLDSKGFLLFWSFSTVSSYSLGMPMVGHNSWKLLGKLLIQNFSSLDYKCLRWAASVLNQCRVLLMGHSKGIDCFVIKVSESEHGNILCHRLCTIPFFGHNRSDSPTNIFAIPLPSDCERNFMFDNFRLIGVWMKEFQALSWKVSLHSKDISESSCQCNFDTKNGAFVHEDTFLGNRYSVVAVPCSSKLPDPHNIDQVTAVAVVCSGTLMPYVQQNWGSPNVLGRKYAAYHMATGCLDGTVKLWRSSHSRSLSSDLVNSLSPWELVGMFCAHPGPICSLSFSECGKKIATISKAGHSDNVSTLHIWDPICLIGGGNYLVEDKISIDEAVIALNWFTLGNGQLLLGICMRNELRVYAQRRHVPRTLEKSAKSLDMHIWFCLASARTSPVIQDFLWGPSITPILVHERYFCHFSQWSFHVDKKYQARCRDIEDTRILSTIFTDCNSCNVEELSTDKKGSWNSILPGLKSTKVDSLSNNYFLTVAQRQYSLTAKIGWWNILKVAEKLGGSLPIYNPEALLLNIHAGKWKRAYTAIQHLVEYLKSDNASVTCQNGSLCIPQIHLSKYFEELFSTSLGDKGLQWGEDASMVSSSAQFEISSTQFGGYSSTINGTNNMLTYSAKSEVSSFIETLEKSNYFAAIRNSERMQMLALIDLLGEVSGSHSSSYDSLDEPGRRFWVALRFQQFYFFRRSERSASAEDLAVDSELIGWAFHSDCQENLLSSFLSNEPSWQEMRNLGVGFWFTNSAELRTRMEKLARLQYLKKKDPKDCALLYIALNRVQVLAGLFKISRDEKDKPMVGFLSRNFQEEKNKAAALKNAYVLLGKHHLELAIAFFLLGGEPSSAVTICAKNLGDEQLALVLCRLLEGTGGPLECHLISKLLLPAAIEKHDHWLSSFLEWRLGNYPQSFLSLLSFETGLVSNKPALLSNAAFLDPSVGQYCLMLTSKSRMRNSVGESVAAMLSRWATWMTATALNRCGLPLEALEWLSSSSGILEDKDHGSVDSGNLDILHRLLKSLTGDASNWLSGSVAFHLESHSKLDLAIQYLSGLIMEHPVWQDIYLGSDQALPCTKGYETDQFKSSHESFQLKLNTGLAIFEQKYALNNLDLINMILVFSCNHGLPFFGYQILRDYNSQGLQQDEFNNFLSLHIIPTLILKAVIQVCYLVVQNIVVWSFLSTDSTQLTTNSTKSDGYVGIAWNSYVARPIRSLSATLQIYCAGILREKSTIRILNVLDLFEYYTCFSSAWSLRNYKDLILLVQPILIMDTNNYTPSEADITNLKKVICQAGELTTNSLLSDDMVGFLHATETKGQNELGEFLWSSIPEEERWPFLGASIWQFLTKSAKVLMQPVFDGLEEGQAYDISLSRPFLQAFNPITSLPDGNVAVKQINMVTVVLAELLKSSLSCVSSSHIKQLASFLRQKVEVGLPIPTLVHLEKSRSQPRSLGSHPDWRTYNSQRINGADWRILFEILWEIFTDPKEKWKDFAQENVSWLQFISQKSCRSWSNIYKETIGDGENADTSSYDQVERHSNSSSGAGSPAQYQSDGHSFLGPGWQASTITREAICFEHPKEIYKKNGVLLEAICINSIDQRQTALASNRKGITFFKWKDEEPFKDQSDYIWSEADWPQDGWAGSESTPIPTFVSPGVGLGSKKGSHLGLGGATIGLRRPSAKPGKEMTGGGAFGIPGYAGIGASGFGWGVQEDFDEFVDLPATVENISTRALSSHPTRPLFLVGSSNTHVYLWEFCKDRATATYGVLPAANVPPPYALASISALQFDHCGQRFATAASDGTVCTWQLEVGGRSNVPPTEAALCFNSHALDVSYVAGSGSIIAAAGCSSNGVNVVIWDTLAPSTTSQASLMCHEGGARSLSVFDHDIGSGSISPLIVTGGKGGDVGVHDFRFIATGRTKRNRHFNASEQNTNSSLTHDRQSGTSNKFGEQNLNGMLWYIPKAHLGSVTRISTIPNTSLFLTGSKDGDVKLWDAKRAELVFHWPKLHEKHSFLQPSSRGFGGVVRAAVTDIQVLSDGFLTCGGDGTVKLIQLKDFHQRT